MEQRCGPGQKGRRQDAALCVEVSLSVLMPSRYSSHEHIERNIMTELLTVGSPLVFLLTLQFKESALRFLNSYWKEENFRAVARTFYNA